MDSREFFEIDTFNRYRERAFPADSTCSRLLFEHGAYAHLPSESADQYIFRILKLRCIACDAANFLDKFVEFIVGDCDLFEKIVQEVPSFRLKDTSGETLYVKLIKKVTVSQASLTIAELAKRGELDRYNTAYLKQLVTSKEDSPKRQELLLELTELQRAQETEEKRKREHPDLDENHLCQSLIYSSACGFCDSIAELLSKLAIVNVSYPATEILLGSLLSGHVTKELKAILENYTPEELASVLYFSRLPKGKSVVIYFNHLVQISMGEAEYEKVQLTISPGQNCFEIAANAMQLQVLDYLTALIARRGDDALKAELALMQTTNSAFQLIFQNQKLKAITEKLHKMHQANPRHYTVKPKSIVARHIPETKHIRQEAKNTLKTYLEGIFRMAQASNCLFCDAAKIQETESKADERATFYLKSNQRRLDRYDMVSWKITPVGPVQKVLIRNGREKAFLNPKLSPITPQMLSHIFKGDRFEHEFKAYNSCAANKEYWDNWNSFDEAAWKQYSDNIHPLITEVAVHLLHVLALPETPRVIEICAGNGRLADKIIEAAKQPLNYTLLEFNESEIKDAKKLLGTKAQVVKTDIVKDHYYYKDETKKEPIGRASVDLAIGSGALTNYVLNNKSEALTALFKLYHYLKPGGYVVLAGHSRSLLSSFDFFQSGFEVLNTHAPGNDQQLYILRKRQMP